VNASNEHEEIDRTGQHLREKAFEVTRVWNTKAVVDPETWQQRYDQAVKDFEAAEASHDSAVLWDKFETAAKYSPAPPEPEAGQ
jgi:hypothetical protein